MDLRPGDEVYGEDPQQQVYRVETILKPGGFGLVYRVRDSAGNPLALKTIVSAYLDDTELRALVNEGHLAVRIRHPNVLSVHYLHDGTTYPSLPPYILMDYADGGTLADVISERRTANRPFEADEVRELMRQLAEGMRAISQHLVHRDVKPDNLLLKAGTVRIADFGLAKLAGATTRSQTFKGIAHIVYASPEAWVQEKNLTTMDVYSMGLVFFELATLRHAYVVPAVGDLSEAWRKAHLTAIVPDPRSLNPKLDLATAQLIVRMTAKRAKDRYQSWDDIIARLSGNTAEESKGRPNVSGLVERALRTRAEHESERLAAERSRHAAAERESLVEVAFREVADEVRELVGDFNNASDVSKLDLEVTHLKVRVFPQGRYRRKVGDAGIDLTRNFPEVTLAVEPVSQGHEMDLRPVLGWGGVQAPSGRGFNLILTRGTDEVYGEWSTLHNEHSPMAVRRDRRPDPFPFSLSELPIEIGHVNSIHIYQSRKGAFQAAQLLPLLEELL